MPETRGSLPKALWPGVRKWTGEYDKHPDFWSKIFMKDTSDKNHEEDVELAGMGLAVVKSEGGSSSYDNLRQGPVSNYVHLTYSLGFIVTEEEFDDNQYVKVAKARSTRLAFSFRSTKEVVAHNILNRAGTSGYNGGDGVTLLSTAHPMMTGGSWANRMAAHADLSEAAIEDMAKLVMKAEDTMGLPIALQCQRLIVAPDNVFEATRIVRSTLQSGTGNNDINAMREMSLFTEDPVSTPFLTDTDAWFIKTNAPDGLKMYQRKDRVIRRDGDFDTDNLKVKGIERYSFGWSDARGIYGSLGSG